MTATDPTGEVDGGEDWEYAIENGWLVQVVNKHTCGTGPDGYYGAHEPGCGMVPIANIAALLDRERREAGAKAWDEGAYAGRIYQQEIQRHAHWSHIGKLQPEPILNPYRIEADR